MMNELERELVGMIRESDEPCKAIMTAVEVISEYLAQRGSSGGQAPAGRQALAGTS